MLWNRHSQTQEVKATAMFSLANPWVSQGPSGSGPPSSSSRDRTGSRGMFTSSQRPRHREQGRRCERFPSLRSRRAHGHAVFPSESRGPAQSWEGGRLRRAAWRRGRQGAGGVNAIRCPPRRHRLLHWRGFVSPRVS